MSLDEVPAGTRVLVDANILLYAVRHDSAQCRRLLERCSADELEGTITTLILAEFNHRRMVEEAKFKGRLGPNPARSLSERPELVRELSRYQEEVRDLLGGGLVVEPVQPEDFHLALEFQRTFALLTNDSLNLALARRLGINRLATADRGFEATDGFQVHRPTDLPGP